MRARPLARRRLDKGARPLATRSMTRRAGWSSTGSSTNALSMRAGPVRSSTIRERPAAIGRSGRRRRDPCPAARPRVSRRRRSRAGPRRSGRDRPGGRTERPRPARGRRRGACAWRRRQGAHRSPRRRPAAATRAATAPPMSERAITRMRRIDLAIGRLSPAPRPNPLDQNERPPGDVKRPPGVHRSLCLTRNM